MSKLSARLRYRFLGSAAKRRLWERLPFGSRIAAHHREALFDIVAGAARQQALLAGLRAGIFDALAGQPRNAAEVERATGLNTAVTARLLSWLVATGLIERLSDDTFALTVEGLVVADDDGVRAMIEHGDLLYADMRDPLALIAGDEVGLVAKYWPYRGDAGLPGDYGELMRRSLPFTLEPILRAVDFSRLRHCCEIGGGNGALAIALARRHPRLDITLVELPDVLPFARAAIAQAGLDGRLSACTISDAARGTFDCVMASRLLHDLDDDAAIALLARGRELAAPRASLVIAEPLAKEGRDTQTAYFTAYFAAMGSGRLRRPDEIMALCKAAGWKDEKPRWLHYPSCSVLKTGH
ncbi:methyltransferase [Aurantiacibacter spongiae]|uniref:methyltransferase n=1 Tax=Aurantiacibacter spongiae TaxID=2488860 RepID=UPI00131570D1|nr:methyltransferase [Aurantiacibacter spongiae]